MGKTKGESSFLSCHLIHFAKYQRHIARSLRSEGRTVSYESKMGCKFRGENDVALKLRSSWFVSHFISSLKPQILI